MSTFPSKRLNLLKQNLHRQKISGFVVSKKENIEYLTGLHSPHPNQRESILFISDRSSLLYHSSFVKPPTIPGLISRPMSHDFPFSQAISSSLPNKSGCLINFEGHNLTFNEYSKLKSELPLSNLAPSNDLVETLRLIKSRNEMDHIKKACLITSKVMAWAIDYTRKTSSITEIALAKKIEFKLIELGGDEIAFPVIVAFGAHSALPHHIPSTRTLKPSDIVLFDFGAKVNGYCSDMTRTFHLNTPTTLFGNIETIVHTAYEKALAILKSSDPTASKVDTAARSYIQSKGYGTQFIHTTGHGLGLDIHEQPSLNSDNPFALEPGMVITLEPGIYLPGKFGYRFENTVSLTKIKPVSLTA